MKQIYANNFTTLSLGRQGENLARKVVFDVRDLESLYGPGDVEVIHQRPGDAQPYPLAVQMDGTLVTWNVTATDTEMSEGYGKCELRYYVGDTLAKSKTWRTLVESAMDTPSEEAPPEPEQGWVDQVVAVGASAKASAEAAKADADRAEAIAQEVAQNAAKTAQEATGAEQAKEAAQTAQKLAEAAKSAAETAKQAAEDAQSAAAQSANDAEGSKQAAEAALKATQDAAAEAAQSLSDLRALYQEMQTWAQGVIQDVDAAGSAAVQSVQSAGDTQVQRVTDEGATQTANAKAQANAAAQSASGAAQSAQQAAESAAVYDDVVTDVNQLKQGIAELRQSTRNIFDENILTVDGITKGEDGYYFGTVRSWNKAFSSLLPVDGTFEIGERYTISCSYYFSEVGDFVGSGIAIKLHYTDDVVLNYVNFNCNNQTETTFYNTSLGTKNIDYLSMNTLDWRANDYILHIKELQIEKGTDKTSYIKHFTAKDIVAEDRLSSVENDVKIYGNTIKRIDETQPENTKVQALLGSFVGRKERYYDHIFIDKLYGNAVIPSESIFNVETSRRLGFSVIEANVHKLSDGNYLVMHGENNKFGRQVVHVDGTTDISDFDISSVSLDWVKANVRYASSYAKYRVSPPTLQEFVVACKYNCLIPLVYIIDTNEIEILNKILGKDNFIVYNSASTDIRNATSAFNFGWNKFDTKEKIIEWVRRFKPCSYGMANINDFTDEQLKDIVDAVHAEGCYIHTAYAKADSQERVNRLGFDFNASLYSVNEFDYGNICNLCGDVTFDDFATSGMAANGEITLTVNQDVSPSEILSSVFLGKGSLHIRFNGTIDVSMGRYINSTYGGNIFTSDGTEDLWLSTFFIEEAPTFTITAKTETTIIGISYKASKC